MARFEVYDTSGAVVFSTGDRVLRVLSVSDVSPSASTYLDPEISSNSAILQGTSNLNGIATAGQVNYSGGDVGVARRPVILY